MTTYTVVRKIASGGNATVYVAKAVSLGIERLVALKKPHPHLVDEPTFVAAFHREAAVAVRLRHPNVVQVLDVVEHEAVPCLVLELVEGPMLSALIRSALARPEVDTTAAAVAIVAAASRGLHALHELRDEAGAPLGLVHRDVSPQNVLVGRDGIT
ncbi:MAG: protein kinase, partial [Myxococcales bacterium]|nr:protein kinase [Myxococcales bacterium]